MMLQFIAALVLGLMCGSELNVAAFAHPSLNRQPVAVHIPVRSSFASLLGRVMPFWMVGSTLLNLAPPLAFREPQHGFVAAGRDRSRYPSGGGCLFSYRSSSNQ